MPIAATWQQLLAPIASHQVIMFMPLFASNYPANAHIFCTMLLEVAAFDAIPAEQINEAIWTDSLETYGDEDVDIGRFESLGFDGQNFLPNMTSTLIMQSLAIFHTLMLLLMSYICTCADIFKRKRGQYLG